MLNKLIAFRDNILLFSLSCYGLGLVHMISYYYVFNIPIVFYINFNDILLFALTTILPIALIAFIFEIVFMVLIKGMINYLLTTFNFRVLGQNGSHILSLVLVIICLTIMTAYPDFFYFKPRHQFLMFIALSVFTARNVDLNSKKDIIMNSILILLLLGLGTVTNSINTKEGNTSTDVQFTFEGENIRSGYFTRDIYLGETSSTIFLYNLDSEKTKVFEKTKINKLIYSDRKTNELDSKKTVSFKEIKSAEILNTEKRHKIKNSWTTIDKKTFKWEVNQNPKGISELLPISLKNDLDYKILNESCKSGNYQINKWWAKNNCIINFRLVNNQYCITYVVSKF